MQTREPSFQILRWTIQFLACGRSLPGFEHLAKSTLVFLPSDLDEHRIHDFSARLCGLIFRHDGGFTSETKFKRKALGDRREEAVNSAQTKPIHGLDDLPQ